MPSLQFDSPRDYDAATKLLIAREMGAVYARIMEAAVELVTVSVHGLGPGGVWRCTARGTRGGGPGDVRRAPRPPVATRAALAEALIAVVVEHGGLSPHQVKVEFTQHDGDEMYHPHLGGFNGDWSPGDTGH